MSAALDFAATEELLLRATFRDHRPLWYSSNYVYLCQLSDDDDRVFAAVYKPQRGENPLWDFPDGALYRREVAAYRFSQLLGWGFIPPTVVRDGPEGIGSLQLFISHDQDSHFFTQRDQPELLPQLKRMAVFDFITNNADRKGGHCLLDAHSQVWGIDHGLCFHAQYKMRTVMWDWVDEPIPAEWLEDIASAAAALRSKSESAAGVIELLAPAEIRALLGRIEQLLEAKTFPKPGPQRSHPWPLV
ncbi:MAG TPA: SCO1664 family protein [Tepidiformaceae bacterium]